MASPAGASQGCRVRLVRVESFSFVRQLGQSMSLFDAFTFQPDDNDQGTSSRWPAFHKRPSLQQCHVRHQKNSSRTAVLTDKHERIPHTRRKCTRDTDIYSTQASARTTIALPPHPTDGPTTTAMHDIEFTPVPTTPHPLLLPPPATPLARFPSKLSNCSLDVVHTRPAANSGQCRTSWLLGSPASNDCRATQDTMWGHKRGGKTVRG